jgi:hypothetical protein
MATHTFKTTQPYFQQILDGTKTAELRENDRNYQVGDTLILQEYDPVLDLLLSTDPIVLEVTCITQSFHLRENCVMLSFVQKFCRTRFARDMAEISRMVGKSKNPKEDKEVLEVLHTLIEGVLFETLVRNSISFKRKFIFVYDGTEARVTSALRRLGFEFLCEPSGRVTVLTMIISEG